MQAQFLQNFLGIAREFFVFLVGVFRARKLHQFHFLKLMLPDDAAHIFPVRSRLAAKAGRVGGERNRQPRLVQHFIAIKIRDRNFRRGNQPEIFVAVRHAERIGGKLRQLPRAVHRLGIH